MNLERQGSGMLSELWHWSCEQRLTKRHIINLEMIRECALGEEYKERGKEDLAFDSYLC